MQLIYSFRRRSPSYKNHNQWQKLWDLPPLPPYSMLVQIDSSFLVFTASYGFFRIGATLSQGQGGFWVTLSKSNVFLWTFLWKCSESQLFLSLLQTDKSMDWFLCKGPTFRISGPGSQVKGLRSRFSRKGPGSKVPLWVPGPKHRLRSPGGESRALGPVCLN